MATWILKRQIYTTLLLIISTILLFSLILIYFFWSLPNTQVLKDKCFSTTMYQLKVCKNHVSYIKKNEVSEIFIQSLIISEDASFYSHRGLDFEETWQSFKKNITNLKFARGGSTITQQLVKNLFLNQDKTILRKIKEAILAQKIEENYNKNSILEMYLNIVNFGNKKFGIYEAAKFYFNKSPFELNELESIYLVHLLPSPDRLSAGFKNKKLSKYSVARIQILLKKLLLFKKITHPKYQFLVSQVDSFPWEYMQNELPDSHQTQPNEIETNDSLQEINSSQSINIESDALSEIHNDEENLKALEELEEENENSNEEWNWN